MYQSNKIMQPRIVFRSLEINLLSFFLYKKQWLTVSILLKVKLEQLRFNKVRISQRLRTPYMHQNHGAFITSVMFTCENYNGWSTKLISALRTKPKLGFINGTIPKLSIDDPNLALWSSVNFMIVDGIQSSIEARV